MAISIYDYRLSNHSHNLYDVSIYSHTIHTLVTDSPTKVEQWLYETDSNCTPMLVGLDVEWRPSFNRQNRNPVAVLQLCVQNRCLIYQIIHSSYIPRSLCNWLLDANHTFVGVGIGEDVHKLVEDYDLRVANAVDLRYAAAEKYGIWEMRHAGLTRLATEVLGMNVVKPRNITMSRWDSEWLDLEQVKYACVDAFLSYEIGSAVIAGRGRGGGATF